MVRDDPSEHERLTTSDRLRIWAQLGAKVKTWAKGPIDQDATAFGGQCGNFMDINWDDPDGAREQIFAAHLAGRWAEHGFNVFDLSPDLAAAFLLTEPPPIDPERELALPFPAFYIRLPPETVPVFSRGQQMWAEGIWCNRFAAVHNQFGPGTPFFRWTVERRALSVWKDRIPTDLEATSHDVYNRVWEGDPPAVPEDDITTDRALRIIRNLVSWLDATGGLSAHPRPQPPRLKKKASKERQRAVDDGIWPRTWIFGQDVKLRPELRRMAKEFALVQSPHKIEGWEVRVQHVVRGHWKMQAHGEARALRKRLWIEPYWRGPEGAAAWAHLYTAEPGR